MDKTDAQAPALDDLDKRLIYLLSGDLSYGPEPFAEIAKILGVSEDEILKRARHMKEVGLIRRFGATLRHQRSGFVANALSVWRLSPEKATEAGERLAALPYVSHCYQRTPAPGWPFTLYAMFHARSREELLKMYDEMRELVQADESRLLESLRELKKTSLRYFVGLELGHVVDRDK